MALRSALDLLSLSDHEQEIIRCLIRQPALTFGEIAAQTQLPPDNLEPILAHMLQERQLTQETRDGQQTFSVQFGQEPTKRRIRNISPAIIDIFE